MFWMLLGDDGYARSSYWKWRKNERGGSSDPRVFKVDCANKDYEVCSDIQYNFNN